MNPPSRECNGHHAGKPTGDVPSDDEIQPQSSHPPAEHQLPSSAQQLPDEIQPQTLQLTKPASSQTAPLAMLETITFETGNPDTHSIISGSLDVRSVTGASPILCVQSVPGLMTSADFCMFVRPFSDRLLHFRLLRLTSERNRYIVIVHLKSCDDAQNFAQVFIGKHYLQGLVQETCAIREVCAMRFDNGAPSAAEASSMSQFPNHAMFPDERFKSQRQLCAVCLERLDEQSAALVTTFCNHTMHASCLAKWDLNRCPVCRHAHELTPEASTCMHCNNREDLWMCVVCAYVGCGVYKKKHAHQHFDETQHPFAMNLEDCTFWSGEKLKAGSVWDYISDRFVNRLLTSEDGKIVEVAHSSRTDGAGASSADAEVDVCCSSTTNTGLEEEDEENDRGLQAAVYASKMDAVVDEYRTKLERKETEHAKEMEALKEKFDKARVQLAEAAKERKALNRRVADSEKEAKTLRDRNGFLKSLNETLLRDKRGWDNEVEKLKAKLAESESARASLEEQLRDVMMHLETQSKIVGSSDSCRSGASELCGGDVLRVGPSARERLVMKTKRR